MLTLIAPFSQSFDDIWLTYSVPEELIEWISRGLIVKIPIWKKETYGVIIDINQTSEFDPEKIKPIIQIFPQLKLSPLQIYLIRFIASHYFVAIHKSASLFFSKFSQEKLLKNKFILEGKEKHYEFNYEKKLSPKQQEVLNKILTSTHNTNLIRGVTGSGKTEIYIQLLQKNLLEGKQWLFLIPEIILGSQIVERLKQVFWEDIAFIHSWLTEKGKHDIWKSIYLWETKIIVWTRSALFYPYTNLWYIIQDEEHDRSYKSENSPRYNTWEILEEIGKNFNIKILLWSGTPSIKTMFKAQSTTEIGYFWLLEEFKEST